MAHFNHPATIVMGAPDVAIGPLRRRCMICEQLFPLAMSTEASIQEMRRRKLLYVLVCWDDHRKLQRKLNDAVITSVDGLNSMFNLDAGR